MTESYDWHIGVFGQNEGRRIGQCLGSIAKAATGRRVFVTVLLNGTTDDSARIARQACQAQGLDADIQVSAVADKAAAINRFFRQRLPAEAYLCVDAYALVGQATLASIASMLADRPQANIVTGIGVNGRSERASAERTLRQGGIIHGQLYALRPSFLNRMQDRGIALPAGLYRGDGLLGSMAAHDLDPALPWEDSRLPGAPEATYEIDRLSPFSPSDIRRQFRRKVRQMRGVIENAAIKSIIYPGGYEALPDDADAMIAAYLARHGVPAVGLADRLFMRLALRQHRAHLRGA